MDKKRLLSSNDDLNGDGKLNSKQYKCDQRATANFSNLSARII